MTPNVIGLDLSITATGIAWLGNLATAGGDADLGDSRLTIIQGTLAPILEFADLVMIEDLPKHGHGAGITAMVHGVVRIELIHRGIPYALVIPSSVKKYATGKGSATKADMRMELFKRAGIDERDDNKVDAWWLRAMGLDFLGAPPLILPAAHRASLAAVKWPAGLALPS